MKKDFKRQLLKNHTIYLKQIKYSKHLIKTTGKIGFKITCFKKVTEKQQTSLKLIILKNLKELLKKKTKVWFFWQVNQVKTKLPLETRMGKGKGHIVENFGFFKPGSLLFEVSEIDFEDALILKNRINKKNILKVNTISNFCY